MRHRPSQRWIARWRAVLRISQLSSRQAAPEGRDEPRARHTLGCSPRHGVRRVAPPPSDEVTSTDGGGSEGLSCSARGSEPAARIPERGHPPRQAQNQTRTIAPAPNSHQTCNKIAPNCEHRASLVQVWCKSGASLVQVWCKSGFPSWDLALYSQLMRKVMTCAHETLHLEFRAIFY